MCYSKKELLYVHRPMFTLLIEVIVAFFLLIELIETISLVPMPILGICCYGLFLLVMCILIGYNDFSKVFIISDSSILIQQRTFPFINETITKLNYPVRAYVGAKSASRGSLVRIYLKDRTKEIPLTRARVMNPSAAGNLVKNINAKINLLSEPKVK